MTCFEPREGERKETPAAEMGRTESTRSVEQKSTGKKILLVIAAIAVGIFVQVLGTVFLNMVGLGQLAVLQVFIILAGFAVMGVCAYYWAFRAKKGKQKQGNASAEVCDSISPTIPSAVMTHPPATESTLDSSSTALEEVPEEPKRGKEETKKSNRLVWEIPLLVVLIIIAVLIWQKPDWSRVSSYISTFSPPTQQADTKGSDTEIVLLIQYFNRAEPIVEQHTTMMSETIEALDEATEKLKPFSGIHTTTTEEMVRWLTADSVKKAAISEIESSIHKIDSEIINVRSLGPPDEAMAYHSLIRHSFRLDKDALEDMLMYWTLKNGHYGNEAMDRANQQLQKARQLRSEAARLKQSALIAKK